MIPHKHRQQSGFSLVELMLALALGLVVVTGIVQLFVGNSRTYETLTAQARLQENGRFALEFLSQAARSAGYFGCALDRSSFVNGLGGNFHDMPDQEFNIRQFVQAQPGGRIRFLSMQRPGRRLMEVLQPDGNPRIAAPGGDPGIEAGDVVVLGNCEQGAIFRVTNVNVAGNEAELVHRPAAAGGCAGSTYTAAGNAQCVVGLDVLTFVPYTLSKLNRAYGSDGSVGVLETVEFFVQDGVLWQERNGVANELVSGVDAIQIRYGLDTNPNDGDRRADRYVPFADLGPFLPVAATDPNPIVALRVSVTVSEPVAAEDVLQRTFSKTILLRNSNPEA
jgi:type IV pilus assembly protein PilW